MLYRQPEKESKALESIALEELDGASGKQHMQRFYGTDSIKKSNLLNSSGIMQRKVCMRPKTG